MDYKNELQKLLKYCKESADYITDEDCTEDKYARMAYRDVIGEIEKIFEREQESSDETAALPLHDVSNNEVAVCDSSCPYWGYQCNINEMFKECTKHRK